MATTTRGYRYPTSADDVRPYEDLQFLATDVDADMANVDRGPVGKSNAAAADTTTSATYVSMAGTDASGSITKTRAGTRLRVAMAGGWSASAGGTVNARFGMLVNGVDTDVTRAILGASGLGQFSGWAYITGLPAGTYTFTARWRREGGTGTAQRTVANDWLCIEAEEVI